MNNKVEKNEYDKFFEYVKKFKEEQRKQKQRGLNNYNIFTTIRNYYEEVGLHSNFIYSLLNPKGEHYQDELFLNLFIKHVLKINDFGTVYEVNREEQTEGGRRIDFTIKSDKFLIGIEMKIYAQDQDKQIKDYYESLKKEAKKNQEVKIYYLTIDGKDASKNSSDNVDYKKVSFGSHILTWLEKCKYEVQNITNLNEAIKQYIDVVKMLNNTYKDKVMKLEDELLKDENKFALAKEIAEAYEKAKLNIQVKFWEELQKALNEKKENYKFVFVTYTFDEKNIVDLVKNYYTNPKKNMYYGLKYDIYKIDDKYTLSFYIEVDWNLTYGITIQENGERKPLAQNENFKKLSENILQSKEIKWDVTNEDPKETWWIGRKIIKLDFIDFNNDNINKLIKEFAENKMDSIEEIVNDTDSIIDSIIEKVK